MKVTSHAIRNGFPAVYMQTKGLKLIKRCLDIEKQLHVTTAHERSQELHEE